MLKVSTMTSNQEIVVTVLIENTDKKFRVKCDPTVSASWLITEVIKRYEAETYGMDPGIIGLYNTSSNEEIDLCDPVSHAIRTGDELLATVQHENRAENVVLTRIIIDQSHYDVAFQPSEAVQRLISEVSNRYRSDHAQDDPKIISLWNSTSNRVVNLTENIGASISSGDILHAITPRNEHLYRRTAAYKTWAQTTPLSGVDAISLVTDESDSGSLGGGGSSQAGSSTPASVIFPVVSPRHAAAIEAYKRLDRMRHASDSSVNAPANSVAVHALDNRITQQTLGLSKSNPQIAPVHPLPKQLQELRSHQPTSKPAFGHSPHTNDRPVAQRRRAIFCCACCPALRDLQDDNDTVVSNATELTERERNDTKDLRKPLLAGNEEAIYL